MKRLRIRRTDQIICYDTVGMFSVARAAWMLRYFGADNVRIMNGGLQKWQKEGRATVASPYTDGAGLPEDGDYDYDVVDDTRAIMNIGQVHKAAYNIYHGKTTCQITDARGASRFNSTEPTKKGVRSGHITGSINVPFPDLVDK